VLTSANLDEASTTGLRRYRVGYGDGVAGMGSRGAKFVVCINEIRRKGMDTSIQGGIWWDEGEWWRIGIFLSGLKMGADRIDQFESWPNHESKANSMDEVCIKIGHMSQPQIRSGSIKIGACRPNVKKNRLLR
jgi:hypothetical protein